MGGVKLVIEPHPWQGMMNSCKAERLRDIPHVDSGSSYAKLREIAKIIKRKSKPEYKIKKITEIVSLQIEML